ncbi:MAG TPA: hypothetical protein VJ862_00425, partial [Rhodanobacteraceae bacterium]|nr:hypothetical protein [Rhodanobacteraceae bacterium]
MNRFAVPFLAAALLGGCASAPPPKPPPNPPTAPMRHPASPVPNAASPRNAPSSLADGIDAWIAQPRFAHAQWGIDV